MANLLSIDASTEACSVALMQNESIIERYQVAPRQHANLLLPLVEELLAESQLTLTQLDAIACHVGPGAFTGIRIGVAIAQGLAYAASLPTIAVSSLASLAQQAWHKSDANTCFSAIDARMNEVYFGVFHKDENGLASALQPEIVVSPDLIDLTDLISKFTQNTQDKESILKIGSGWGAYAEKFQQPSDSFGIHIENKFPRASAGVELALQKWQNREILAPQDLQPVYLRNNVAAKKSVKN